MPNEVKVEVEVKHVELKRGKDRNPFSPKKLEVPELIPY